MRSGFKKIRSLKIPTNRQGFLHYMCLGYSNLPKSLKDVILEVIDKVCKNDKDRKMMREFLLTDKSLVRVAIEHYSSERKIYRLRTQIYSLLYKMIYIDNIFFSRES